MEELKKKILEEYEKAEDKVKFLNELRLFIHEISPFKHNPCDCIIWEKLENVKPNDYNPNVVPKNEFELLYTSIKEDGYTMPIVVFDEGNGSYTIIDGYHRYMVSKIFEDIRSKNLGYIPISIVKGKTRAERIASTIRHNRARGQHQIVRMPNLILELSREWKDEDIMKKVGLDLGEIQKIKILGGYASLFKDKDYSKSWIPAFVLETFYKKSKKDS